MKNQRAAFFQIAYSSAAAMVMHTTGAGSKYPYTTRDKEGKFLNGGNTYKLHLPPNPPAALFWAVTAYNITDGTMPETDQLLPSTNGYYNLPKKTATARLISGLVRKNRMVWRITPLSRRYRIATSSLPSGYMAPKTVSTIRPGYLTIWFRQINE